MALLLGRGRRARRLVPPARRPLATAAPRRRTSGDAASPKGCRGSCSGRSGSRVQALSVALFALVWAAALLGDTDPYRNLAPTWVYVVFWLGVPGTLGRPRERVAGTLAVARARGRLRLAARSAAGREAKPLAEYPERLGRYPAAVALFAFVALELAYADPSSPRSLAFAIALYTYVTLFGMATFGRETWERHGEGFAVLFGFFARIGPLFARDGRIRVRWPLTGLAGADRIPGTLAFVAVMLGSVLFDGYSRTTTWQDLAARVEGPFIVDQPLVGELLVTLVSLGGLLAAVLLVAAAYAAACAAARWAVNAPRRLEGDFLLSLVPIAFVYVVAHYFSTFVIQGQFAVPLLSDPLGKGLGPPRHGGRRAEPRSRLADDDVVRPGRRARRRARGGPRDRARPRGDDLPRPPDGVALAAPPARADGALHDRRAVGALARVIAHHPSGLALAVELGVLAVLVVGFGGLWLRERRRRLDRTRRVPEMRE